MVLSRYTTFKFYRLAYYYYHSLAKERDFYANNKIWNTNGWGGEFKVERDYSSNKK